MQMMQYDADFFNPASQFQQHETSQCIHQQQQQMFVMPSSPVMYNPWQQDMSSPNVVMQTVFVPYPCNMQQVGVPQGSGASADPWGSPGLAPKSLKGRKGRAAGRKAPTGALCGDEVQELKCAVQKQIRGLFEPALLCASSKSDCSTAEGLSDAGANDDSAEGSCRTPSETADLNHSPNSPSHGCFSQKFNTSLADLDSSSDCKRQVALQWVLESFWLLAFDKQGCRIVQKAVDVGSPAYQLQLLGNLKGYVNQAVESPHGNYVLQKFIQTVPPEQIQFIVTEVHANVLYIACHRFGCRILQRLLEQCKPQQTEHLINKVLADADSLCRHQYGNFILQHILQYGSASQRSTVANMVLADIIRLSKHRLASHIVCCALTHCSKEDVQRLTHAVLHDEAQLHNLSRREFGSFVVREVHRAARLLPGGAPKEIEVSICAQDVPKELKDDNLAQEMNIDGYMDCGRQCTLDVYMDAMNCGRQCTAGAYMD